MPNPRPTRVRWLILAMLVGFTFLAHFNRISISVAGNAQFIGPEKLSKEAMGKVYSAFLLVYTICMLPGGWLIDRLGPRRTMAVMALGLGTCTALTGALGWSGLAIASLFIPLLAIRGLAGATSVPLHPGAARSVSLWFPLRERVTANGLVTAGALVGIAVTYPVFGWLMDHLDWPVAFLICGSVLVGLGLVWLALVADNPAGHAWANAAEQQLVAADGPAPARARVTFREVVALFGNRSLVLLTLSYGAIGYVQYLFFYWVEYYFGNVLNLSPDESREAAFTITLAMAVGMAAGGWVSDKLSRSIGPRWGYRTMALFGMASGAMFSWFGIATSDPRQVVFWFSLSLGALGLCEGIFWTTAPTLAKRSGGLACALVNTGGNGVGMLAPVVTPWLADRYGWESAIIVACSVCAIGGVLWLGISPGSPEEPSSPAEPEPPL
jgi:MFS transporter, ACS family, D-galactonate transporter